MADREQQMTLAEIDAELARRGAPPQSDALAQIDAELARRSKGRPTPANAGLAKFLTSAAGAPVDAVENVLNLGIAGYGAARGAVTGKPQDSPDLLQGSVGGSQWLQDRARATGEPGLSPDNPTPSDKAGTAAYELAARGGMVPGGAVPAIASLVAEHTLGPEWAGPASLAPGAARQSVRISPKTPEAEMLQKEGVNLTPGQLRGGVVKRVEDGLTSVPVLGDSIRGAQRRGMEQYTRAAINRSLRPIGERLPDDLTGNKAIEYAYGKLGDKYDELLPNLKGDLDYKAVPPSGSAAATGRTAVVPSQGQAFAPTGAPSLREELDSLRNLGQNLPEPQRGQLGRIIDKEIVGRFTPQGLASGETLKEIESQLGVLKKDFRKSENYDVRSLGDAVDEMQGSLRRMVERVNPQYQGELQKINEGYANFKVTQRAASNVGAPEGVFTAAQLHRAARASDQSKDKGRFAEGNALMQDLSTAGKKVMPSTVPDSGSPFRAALMYAAANPVKAGVLAIPVGAASLAYSPAGMKAIAGLSKPGATNLEQQIAQAIMAEHQGKQKTLEEWFKDQ